MVLKCLKLNFLKPAERCNVIKEKEYMLIKLFLITVSESVPWLVIMNHSKRVIRSNEIVLSSEWFTVPGEYSKCFLTTL